MLVASFVQRQPTASPGGAPSLSQAISVCLSASLIGEVAGGIGGPLLPFMRISATSYLGTRGLPPTLRVRKSSSVTSDMGAPLTGTGPWQRWQAFASARVTSHGTPSPPAGGSGARPSAPAEAPPPAAAGEPAPAEAGLLGTVAGVVAGLPAAATIAGVSALAPAVAGAAIPGSGAAACTSVSALRTSELPHAATTKSALHRQALSRSLRIARTMRNPREKSRLSAVQRPHCKDTMAEWSNPYSDNEAAATAYLTRMESPHLDAATFWERTSRLRASSCETSSTAFDSGDHNNLYLTRNTPPGVPLSLAPSCSVPSACSSTMVVSAQFADGLPTYVLPSNT